MLETTEIIIHYKLLLHLEGIYIVSRYFSEQPSVTGRRFRPCAAVERTSTTEFTLVLRSPVRGESHPGLGSVATAQSGSDFRVEVHTTDQRPVGLEGAIQLSRKDLSSAAGRRSLSIPNTLLATAGSKSSYRA